MAKRFRECSLDQPYLMAPSLQDWLPEDHLARFIADMVETLDLGAVYAAYERKDGRGLAAYHPLMLTRLLLYGYCVGVRSSRRIEKATHDDVAFRYLAADQHPDHDTIAHFRQEHLQTLGGLFVQALRLCQQAGLVKLGVVALDGTKIRANASGAQSMKYQAMEAEERRLQELVDRMLAEATQVDASEDAQWGKGQREQALPPDLARAEDRLNKLRQAKRELEQEAQQRLAEAASLPPGKRGPKSKDDDTPRPSQHERERRKSQLKRARRDAVVPARTYNFTDPDSRLMHDNGLKRIVQSYNAQLAVDALRQVIVAAEVTQQVNDRQQLVPMSLAIGQTAGAWPEVLLADAGYWATTSLEHPSLQPVRLLVSPDAGGQTPRRLLNQTAAQRMRQALRQPAGRALYRLRQTTVEPVIGCIKELRNFRRFSVRGLAQVAAEWKLICLTHNLLKLHRYRTVSV